MWSQSYPKIGLRAPSSLPAATAAAAGRVAATPTRPKSLVMTAAWRSQTCKRGSLSINHRTVQVRGTPTDLRYLKCSRRSE
ncbi:hypothetical protein E2C01_031018 [Portunus trituberculatus]|uniref:Uncharacterized protein n=1 Tax=Portunus trituberculatus TaxID=210409 RepID=A0A5B7EVR8_PORTR|nr:hypothetical protein [Portunus trituberculatus]